MSVNPTNPHLPSRANSFQIGLGWSEEYYPYGSTSWRAPELTTISNKRYRFTGMERDEESGLQCHGRRYYAPWLGRWTSADPIGLGDGVNRFAYCHGDPVGGRDPSALESAETGGAAGWTLLPRLAKSLWDEHGEATTTAYSTHVDPRRSPETRNSGAGYFDSDWAGEAILRHWLGGAGGTLDLGPTTGDPSGIWASYMKTAPGVRPASAELARFVAQHFARSDAGIYDAPTAATHVETENGESMIGRQYLHGTNPEVGDFSVRGTAIVEHRPGETVVILNLKYTWNDLIDPNFIYDTDSWKAALAESIADPEDYTIRISWDEQSVWKFDDAGQVTSAQGWPAPDLAQEPLPNSLTAR